MALLRCADKACPNVGNWCYVLDSIHLRIQPFQMTTWSKSINNGAAQIDSPPDGLAKGLNVSKPGTKNPLREENTTKAQNQNFLSQGPGLAKRA